MVVGKSLDGTNALADQSHHLLLIDGQIQELPLERRGEQFKVRREGEE